RRSTSILFPYTTLFRSVGVNDNATWGNADDRLPAKWESPSQLVLVISSGPSGDASDAFSASDVATRSVINARKVFDGAQCKDARSEEHTSELQSPDHLV